MRRTAEDFRSLLEDRGVALAIALPPGKLWASADATRVAQVVGNLLHNAAKFTSRGGEVRVSLDADGAMAVLRVRDTGAGIEPELLPRMFEPFVQGDRTLACASGGLGLGLALVKGIAELHGGAVRAESGGRGRGAEVAVRLPLEPAPGLPSADRQAIRTSAGRRVLVVDDNVDAAETLAEIVRLLGHDVLVAYDGGAAVEAVRAPMHHRRCIGASRVTPKMTCHAHLVGAGHEQCVRAGRGAPQRFPAVGQSGGVGVPVAIPGVPLEPGGCHGLLSRDGGPEVGR